MYLPLLSTNTDRLANPGSAKFPLYSTGVPFTRRADSSPAPSGKRLLNKVVWEPLRWDDMVVYVRRLM